MSNRRPYLQRIDCEEVTNMPDTSESTLERMLVQDERFPMPCRLLERVSLDRQRLARLAEGAI